VRVHFTLRRSPVEANSVVVTICTVGVSLTGCVHSSVNEPGTNRRVSYDSLTHSRLYCRNREKVGHELKETRLRFKLHKFESTHFTK